jgi:hypothetical protein
LPGFPDLKQETIDGICSALSAFSILVTASCYCLHFFQASTLSLSSRFAGLRFASFAWAWALSFS